MENHTAKHFVLQLGSLISLYLSLSFLIVLLFGIINVLFPDAAEGYWAIESATTNIRLGIAMVTVFFPTYLVLTRLVNTARRSEATSAYLILTKWLIYLSLLVGGGVLLGDLVAVIMAFLDGELTQRFILKAVTVLVIVGAAFYYYLQDARGYWLKEEKKSIYFGAGAALIALVSVIYGFTHIETPAAVREMKLDEKQITDLQDIQSRILNYYDLNAALPATLADLPETTPLPEAPEDRDAYTYSLTSKGFELCATFSYPTTGDQYTYPSYVDEKALIKNTEDWRHTDGEFCFERVVTKK